MYLYGRVIIYYLKVNTMSNKINIDLFRICNHKECIEHESTLGEEYLIHDPYHPAKDYKIALSTHLTQANPWIGQSVEIFKNRELIFYNKRPDISVYLPKNHSSDGIRVGTNYTDDMLYNSMNACEKKAYDSLPETCTVYRGYTVQEGVEEFDEHKAMKATSWAATIVTAEFFADYHSVHRTHPKKYIITANISKSDVALVLFGRDEAEIKLFFGSTVDILEVMEIK